MPPTDGFWHHSTGGVLMATTRLVNLTGVGLMLHREVDGGEVRCVLVVSSGLTSLECCYTVDGEATAAAGVEVMRCVEIECPPLPPEQEGVVYIVNPEVARAVRRRDVVIAAGRISQDIVGHTCLISYDYAAELAS